jgi:glycosyltransferase involved in cell wall biosynthesis
VSPPRRILFLTNRLSPAGAETFLLHRVTRLDRSRWHPVVAALRPGGELEPSFRAAGVEVMTFGSERRLDPPGLLRLAAYLRRARIDILEAHVWYACLVARLVGRLAGVPIVITNEQDVRAGANTVRRDLLWLGDATTWMSSACVHITHASQRSFVAGTPSWLEGSARRVVIPNGIDVARVRAAAAASDGAAVRRELGLPADALVIGNVARLQPAKGHGYLLGAFARVLADRPVSRLVIVGWGEDEAALRRRAADLGIAGRVLFLGKRQDVHRLLAAFDLFAFSSIHEGQGIAILEAMAAGVPVVATAADGIPEMVRDGDTGLLVPPRDDPALAAAILRLAGDPALRARLTAAAARMVDSEYSVEAAAARYDQLYDQLLGS